MSCPSCCPTDCSKAVHLSQFCFVCMWVIATVPLCLAPVVVLLTIPRRFSSIAVLLCLYGGYCNCAVVSCPSSCPTDCSKAVLLLQFFFVCMAVIAIIATEPLCLAQVVVLLTVAKQFISFSSSLFVCRLLQLSRCVLPQWLSY